MGRISAPRGPARCQTARCTRASEPPSRKRSLWDPTVPTGEFPGAATATAHEPAARPRRTRAAVDEPRRLQPCDAAGRGSVRAVSDSYRGLERRPGVVSVWSYGRAGAANPLCYTKFVLVRVVLHEAVNLLARVCPPEPPVG